MAWRVARARFQDAKEMTVGGLSKKKPRINAGVTKQIAFWISINNTVKLPQKFSRKLKLMTSHLWMLVKSSVRSLRIQVWLVQSMANESINSTTATEEVTPDTFGFGATITNETQSHIDKQLPHIEPELCKNQGQRILKLSLRQQMLWFHRQKQKNLTLVMHS